MSQASTRRRRTVRAPGATVALTERDIELFTLVGLCKYLAADQLARTFFASSFDVARRRFRKLYDAGYLAFTLRSSTSPNLVSLTKLAVRAVADRDPELAARLKLAGTLRLASVSHHLGVCETRLALVSIAEERGLELVRWEGGQGAFARAHALPSVHLEPDGLAQINGPMATRVLAVEFDAGTETLATMLRSKLERYVSARTARLLDGLVIVADGGERRQRAVNELVAASGLASWAAVLGAGTLRERPVRVPDALARLLPSPKATSGSAGNLLPVLGVFAPRLTHDR
jgi:hypothetical protein